MNTTRNIRIATGVKKIELGNENMAMLQIGEILRQHREALINSLLTDLSTYVKYQFTTPPSKDQLEKIRYRLVSLRNSAINLTKYTTLIEEVLENENTYVRSELFYQEINEAIGEELNPSQLILVR